MHVLNNMAPIDTLEQIKAMNEVFSFQELEDRVFMPGSKEYEASVATSNLLYRFSRPYCVFLPQDVRDVERFVREAALSTTKFNIVIKSGGHCYAGFSTAYTGVLLDLAWMTRVDFDPPEGEPRPKPKSEPDAKSNTVAVAGGAQWGHVYKALVNSRQDGLMVNGGRCPTVGVSGFILGGGLCPFSRSLGLGCDALKEATIVTADRGTVTVKRPEGSPPPWEEQTEEEKLFWALCGAGGGNFGVVVELKLEVQQVNPTLVAGRFTWTTKLDDTFIATMNKFYLYGWPDEATIDSTWLCDTKPTDDPADTGIAVRFTVAYDGSKEDFDTLIDHFAKTLDGSADSSKKQPELACKLKQRSCPEPSTLFLHESLVAQWSEETARSMPSSSNSYSVYSSFVFKVPDNITTVTTTIRKWVGKFRSRFVGEQAGLHITWIHSGGKAAQGTRSTSAFPWRHGTYVAYITIEWQDKWLSQEAEQFLEEFKKDLRPDSMDKVAAYVNFPDRKLREYESAYYGENYKKLQKVKAYWDSGNLFRSPQGVRLPGGQTGSDTGEEIIDLAGHAGRLWEGPKWEPLPRKEGPVGIIRDLADLGF